MEPINKTSIIFDDNFKHIIKDFVHHRVSKIDYKISKQDLEIKQDELRQHMDIEIFPKLTNKIKPSEPNYYTIFTMIFLSDYLDEFKSWDEFMKYLMILMMSLKSIKILKPSLKQIKLS